MHGCERRKRLPVRRQRICIPSGKALNFGAAASLSLAVAIEFLKNKPEFWVGGQEVGTALSSVSYSFFAAWIFNYLVVEIPLWRERRLLWPHLDWQLRNLADSDLGRLDDIFNDKPTALVGFERPENLSSEIKDRLSNISSLPEAVAMFGAMLEDTKKNMNQLEEMAHECKINYRIVPLEIRDMIHGLLDEYRRCVDLLEDYSRGKGIQKDEDLALSSHLQDRLRTITVGALSRVRELAWGLNRELRKHRI